ncbi:MAG TPA: ABC transporter permease [Candidatus Acidoferrum sp.]|nr:ABC transporter permease [Candidatus Acidoferrum sp.]
MAFGVLRSPFVLGGETLGFWHRLGSWVGANLRRSRMESEMDAEMRFHVEEQAEDLERGGMDKGEALRRALMEFGGVEQAKEECRDARGVSFVEGALQDVRFGLRMLKKSPGFTITAVLTLALGIGANTAIFSVVNTVLLRPLPYKDADRLVTVWSNNRTRGYDTDLVSPLDFADWRSQSTAFEKLAASTDVQYTMTGAGEPVMVIGYSFSAEYFDVLGVRPFIGRTFFAEEEQAGKNRVAVLSYGFWQRRFGADRGLVNKTITLDGERYTVVGVMPPEFKYPTRTELWTPLTPNAEAANDRSYRYLRVMGRLRPGASLTQARSEMNGIASRLAKEYPASNEEDDEVNLIPLRENISGDARPALLVLFCAVGMVLLIACANVANLLLARAVARQKEVAVRGTLGASRGRLVRQFLTESMLLGLSGGAIGIFLAVWCTKAMVVMFSTSIFNLNLPYLEEIPLDGWVLGFAAGGSLLTGALFGLAPAVQSSAGQTHVLKESGRGATESIRWRRVRNGLVVAEVAMSIVLLTGAGLTLKSFASLLRGDLGFRADQVLTMRVLLPKAKYANETRRRAFQIETLERIKALPGVKSAGTVTFLPLTGWDGNRTVALAREAMPKEQRPSALWSSVTPEYFQAMGIPLIRGRSFNEADGPGAVGVAIISQSLGRRLAPDGGDLVGQQIEVEGVKGAVEVVGVVGDVRHLGVTAAPAPEVYLPYAQLPAPLLCFAIRTAGKAEGLSRAAESAIWAVDKDQAVGFVMNMNELVSDSLAPERVVTMLLGGFGMLALVMAAVGIYGVMANSAEQRTHEIGIRMAIGARAGEILRMMMAQGLRMVLVGASIGVATAFGLTRFISSVLYGVRPGDPGMFAAATVLISAIALLACWVPARRAARVEPMVALRYE